MNQVNIWHADGKKRRRRNTAGFTLMEVIIAMMLVSTIFLAAFPLVTTGRNVVAKKQKEIEINLLGDGIFDRISGELQNAAELFENTEELETEYDQYGIDVNITIEQMEHGWVYLFVRIMEEETVSVPEGQITVIATGPLTSETMASYI